MNSIADVLVRDYIVTLENMNLTKQIVWYNDELYDKFLCIKIYITLVLIECNLTDPFF